MAEEGGGLSPDREVSDSAQEANDVELLEILFFLADMDANQISAPDVPVSMPDLESSLAAATVLFNRSTHTAHIHEPYGALDDGLHPSVDLLPALEGHTAQLGAQELHVRVHPDAVDLFRTKLGYIAYGRTVRRGGVQVQLMRKVLNDMAVPKCTLS